MVAKKTSQARKGKSEPSRQESSGAKKTAAKRGPSSATRSPAKKKTAPQKASTAKKAPAGKPKAGSQPKASQSKSSKKKSVTKKSPKSTTAPAPATAEAGPAPKNPAAEQAAKVIAGESDRSVQELGDALASGAKSPAAQAARILDEMLGQKPESVVPVIDRYVRVISGSEKRPAQSAALALPVMARVAPARVARHLPKLKDAFDQASPIGKDGLVRTFAGLCTASVAYQKRLEPILNKALSEADAKTLLKWTEVVLPALKGEPHARARATVEDRLGRIPKAIAQKIADFLGIKLRLRYR